MFHTKSRLPSIQIDRKDYIMSTVGQYSASTTSVQEMYDNIGGVRNRGFELSLKSDRKREFTLDMAYSYIQRSFHRLRKFYQTLGSPYVANPVMVHYNNTGNAVPRVPRHSLNTTAGWQPNERFRLALEMDAKSWSWADEINQEKLPGRTLFNLHANYDIRDNGSTRRQVVAVRKGEQPVRPQILDHCPGHQRCRQIT